MEFRAFGNYGILMEGHVGVFVDGGNGNVIEDNRGLVVVDHSFGNVIEGNTVDVIAKGVKPTPKPANIPLRGLESGRRGEVE
jgi:hypothetical protein